MVWTWDSIMFLAASLLLTVFATVKIVERRHVAYIILGEALEAYHRSTTETVEPTVRKSRHRARDEKETEPDPYSARAILARVEFELAASTNVNAQEDYALVDDDTVRLFMLNTDRLFTHGFEAHQ